jgi:hypothetical protein
MSDGVTLYSQCSMTLKSHHIQQEHSMEYRAYGMLREFQTVLFVWEWHVKERQLHLAWTVVAFVAQKPSSRRVQR